MGNQYCYGCGSDNPFGLHLHFSREGNRVVALFQCEERHSGWPGIQHGGITSALLDEASGYVPNFLGKVAMTAELNVSYIAPIRVGETVRITAEPTRIHRRLIEVAAQITSESGEIKAESKAKMFLLTPEQQEMNGVEPVQVEE